MFRQRNNLRSIVLLGLSALSGLMAANSASAAGLVGYRNDTNQVIVVQSIITSNGETRASKRQTLYPGEVVLDGLAFTGMRKIVVYDAKKNIKLFEGSVTNTDDAFYAIRLKAVFVPVKGQPQPPPAVELIKETRATMPKPGKPTQPSK